MKVGIVILQTLRGGGQHFQQFVLVVGMRREFRQSSETGVELLERLEKRGQTFLFKLHDSPDAQLSGEILGRVLVRILSTPRHLRPIWTLLTPRLYQAAPQFAASPTPPARAGNLRQDRPSTFHSRRRAPFRLPAD